MSEKSILVVEDERIVALDLQERLKVLGYAVPVTAARGEEAIQLAMELHPDLVLMDIQLKGEMDGVEAASTIQDHLDVPVIYLTAHADHSTLDRARMTSPYGYILKPFEDRELQTAIDMALYKHSMDAKLRAHAAELEGLKRAIEQVPDSIVVTDAEGKVVYANPSFEQTTGYSASEAVGQHAVTLNRSEEGDGTIEGLQSTIQQGHVWKGQLTNRKKDGTTYISAGSIAPVHDEDGNITSFVSVQRDVTRELELEKQHREALKMEAVGRLAAGIAHDFNNLLTAINGYAALMMDIMPEDDPDYDVPQTILGAGERAAALVKELLTFARKEAVEPEALNLNGLVVGVTSILHRTIGEHIELRTELCPDLWMIQAAPTQIDRVIVNLSVNARDAMPEGGVLSLRTANRVLSYGDPILGPDGSPGDYVMLSVTDTGTGMSEEVQAHLFEPFFTTKQLGRGTGLGLATVYGIVKQSQGHIRVCSQQGEGATFEIYLPRASEVSSDATQGESEHEAERGSETILVVEDDELVRDLTRAILQKQGYRLLMAPDAIVARRLAEEHPSPIDLLLTDVILPGMSGPSLANELAGRFPRLRVLFMSGYPDSAIQRYNGDSLHSHLLLKPFHTKDLTSRVRSVLAS